MHQYTLQAEQGDGEWRVVHNSSLLLLLPPHILYWLQPGAFPWAEDNHLVIQNKLSTAWALHGLQSPLEHVQLPHQGLSWGHRGIPAGDLETLLTSSFSFPWLCPGCRAVFCPPLPGLSPRALTYPPVAEELSPALCWGHEQWLVSKPFTEFFIPSSPVPEALHNMK